MSRDNVLFAIIGILLGFIGGFMAAGYMNQREATSRATATTQQGQNLPPDHPPISGDQSVNPQQMLAQVQEAMKRAREHPEDFEAQVMAARLQYQIQRFDQAIEYLLIANKLKPKDQDVLFMLAIANLDAGHFDAAEKWYTAALLKKPNDIALLDGYCAALLGKGDATKAEAAINKLAKLDPTNQDLPQFRAKLADLKAGKKTS